MKDVIAVLSMGGDNYAVDRDILPYIFTDLDDLAIENKKPMIIWGASVGPFEKFPKYEKYMINHLRKIDGIFARESLTIDYLAGKGVVKNVYRVADPAFLLKPSQPVLYRDMKIEDGAIGINLSPLMAQYVTNNALNEWVRLAAKIVLEVSRKTKRHIYLIPHVVSPHSSDSVFLKNIVSLAARRDVTLVSDTLNAAELKWVISKLEVFAGSRTHSNIASFSSFVPTLSFTYSFKGEGISKDIFGSSKYCLNIKSVTPENVSDKMLQMLHDAGSIRGYLKATIPRFFCLAMDAGKYLKEIIEKRRQ
jgi:polysaccharide pyruvyl transferase WcaK-like protein